MCVQGIRANLNRDLDQHGLIYVLREYSPNLLSIVLSTPGHRKSSESIIRYRQYLRRHGRMSRTVYDNFFN